MDMPPIEAFPKSHIVTFMYYVGVILFLEEDYVKVNVAVPPLFIHVRILTKVCCLLGRREPHKCMDDVPQRGRAEQRVCNFSSLWLMLLTPIIED